MMNDQVVSEFEKQLAELADYDEPSLKQWAKDLLKYGFLYPFNYSIGPEYPSDILYSLFVTINKAFTIANEKKEVLQRNLRKSVLALFKDWRVPDDDLEYLYELVASVPLLGATKDDDASVYEQMLAAVQSETFRGLTIRDEELEVALFRAVFGMGEDEIQRQLARENISRPAFAPLCFRKLWEMKDPDILDHEKTLVDCSLVNPSLDLEDTLARYYSSSEHLFESFVETFLEFLRKLLSRDEIRADMPAEGSAWLRFQSAMQNIGIDISVERPADVSPDFPFIRMSWRPSWTVRWQPLWRGTFQRHTAFLDLGLDSSVQAEEQRMMVSAACVLENTTLYNAPDEVVFPVEKSIRQFLVRMRC